MQRRSRHTIAKLSLTEKLCFIMLTLFLISLLPVCRLAFYAHPAGDDYAYGVAAHLAWTDTHSLSAVLAAAVSNVKGYYTSWQGTYSSIFLMSLQPAIFSQRLYFLTTFLMLFMVIGSIFSLFHVLFTHYIPLSRSLRLMLSLALSFLCVHVIDEGKSAFYWYNGALHYTFMHSCMLFFFALLLLYMKEEKRSKRVFFLLCCCFLAFVIGGANYITGLLSPVILLALLLLCIPAHKKRGLGGILPLLIMLIGFFINVRAPGNAVRIAAQLDSMGPVEAVYYSFVYAVKGIGEWTNLYVIFFAVLLAPFLFRALSGCRFSFPLPGIVLGFSFCLVAASYTPSLYSMGHTYIFGRSLNIMRMLFYLLFFLNLVYCIGWICIRFPKAAADFTVSSSLKKSFLTGLALAFFALVIFSDKDCITGLSAADSLHKQYAQTYHRETLYRYSLITQGPDEVWVPNLSVCPTLLDPQELSEDPSDYRNSSLAAWYGISTIHMSKIY